MSEVGCMAVWLDSRMFPYARQSFARFCGSVDFYKDDFNHCPTTTGYNQVAHSARRPTKALTNQTRQSLSPDTRSPLPIFHLI